VDWGGHWRTPPHCRREPPARTAFVRAAGSAPLPPTQSLARARESPTTPTRPPTGSAIGLPAGRLRTNEDAAIDSAFFGSHAGRTCYARAHHSGWVLVVRQIVAQREPPVMLRVWGRLERVPDDDANCLAMWERCAYAR